MKSFTFSLLATVALCALASPASAQTTQQVSSAGAPTVMNRSGAPADVDRIISTFMAKEAEALRALSLYSFKREAVLQTIGMGGGISGEYNRVSRFVMDGTGKRFEKILFFPLPTIEAIQITPEDIESLGGIQAFTLNPSRAAHYDFTYIGKETIDEISTHVFDVAPKALSNPKMLSELKKTKQEGKYFKGRIWVDDKDMQIVKARGKAAPEFKQRFPTFESYREHNGHFWVPSYTYADDELVFDSGQSVHVRLRIKFTEYERFRGKVRVIEEGEPGVVDDEGNATAPSKPAEPARKP